MAAAVTMPIGSEGRSVRIRTYLEVRWHRVWRTRAESTMCTKNVCHAKIRVHTWTGYTRLLFLVLTIMY